MEAPTQEDILAFLSRLLERTDLDTITLKHIRTRLKYELHAESGIHYEKAWLNAEVQHMLRASVQPVVEQNAPTAKPNPSTELVEALASSAAPTAVEAAPAVEPNPEEFTPLEAGEPDDPEHPAYAVGTVMWAKMPGYPYWPSMVVPPARQSKHDRKMTTAGWHFVKFFGTNQYGYVLLLQTWEGYKEKAERDGAKSTKGKPQVSARASIHVSWA